jgi:hypothetical protein
MAFTGEKRMKLGLFCIKEWICRAFSTTVERLDPSADSVFARLPMVEIWISVVMGCSSGLLIDF